MKKRVPANKREDLTAEVIKAAIEKHEGNVNAARKQLKCSRGTILNRVKEYGFEDLLEDLREDSLDEAESMLNQKIKEGDLTAVIFKLKTQGRKRGYSERYDLDVTTRQAEPALEKLSDEELKTLLELQKKMQND